MSAQAGWPLSCPICGNDGPRFTKDAHLAQHMQTAHRKSSVGCGECSYDDATGYDSRECVCDPPAHRSVPHHNED